MKLYDQPPGKPNPRRVRWLMAEEGDRRHRGHRHRPDGFSAHKTEHYLALAGVANVPALTLDDGETITESLAICRYLESVYPAQPNLFGESPREAAAIEKSWTRRAEVLMAALPLMHAVRHGHPALAVLETQIPEFAAANRATAERSLALFDRRLAVSEWIGAERVTIADGVLFIGLDFARMVRFKVPEELDNLTRWQAAMRARPSWRTRALEAAESPSARIGAREPTGPAPCSASLAGRLGPTVLIQDPSDETTHLPRRSPRQPRAFAAGGATAAPSASLTMQPGGAQFDDGVFRPGGQPACSEQAQFIFGGQNYCWYDGGWRGPGFYWCG